MEVLSFSLPTVHIRVGYPPALLFPVGKALQTGREELNNVVIRATGGHNILEVDSKISKVPLLPRDMQEHMLGAEGQQIERGDVAVVGNTMSKQRKGEL